uniref:Pyrrolo-quinoline quinone repeat domain-containing protein n=1 Tax=Schlesneria paludicola TaxID=360056 RepID=A0A7C2JYY3_9PLAN
MVTSTRLAVSVVLAFGTWVSAAAPAEWMSGIDSGKGIVAVLDLPEGGAEGLIARANDSELLIYFQSADAKQVESVRKAAEDAGLLGQRVFIDRVSANAVRLADNIADVVLVATTAKDGVSDEELLRILRPRAVAFVGDRRLTKPVPDGTDDWSHPFHGPDNNPQSQDRHVRGNFQTQFLARPTFSPMPEQTVAAGGRLYKAMGHIAHKANQNEWLNTLLGINAYNGTILWRRPLPEGFMIHRNTMIATDDGLLMGDHESCKIFDGRTGEIRDQITIPKELTDGPVWKWMALQEGTLYALVGNPEVAIETVRSDRPGLGHWPWGMWQGHDYKDPRTAFGYGRTLVAIDLATKKIKWHFRDAEFLDARAVCMNSKHIFCYCPEKFLACIDAATGQLVWRNTDKNLLEAIGPNEKAQLYITGYATSCYMKCNEEFVFFAGPQRKQMAVASTRDGSLAWTHPTGNLQLVLRDDAIWAAGAQNSPGGVKLDYHTGSVLATLPARRACTRATGCADSIFFRATDGTARIMTDTNTAQHIAPMRPPCQDGVLISNGHLYWGPWMCGCQLSLYGHVALTPASAVENDAVGALVVGPDIERVQPLRMVAGDWSTYRGDNARSDVSKIAVPANVELAWTADVCRTDLPTAPVVAGGMVFVADRTGVVQAFNNAGKPVWKAYTTGAVFYPPTVAHHRVYVGSADGRVYAFEAATGRSLWTYRVAPQDRRIPIFGKLMSRWPVAGGVVVQDDTVYAAAGFTHYDGTYVVALDAVAGQLKAENSTSGVLSEVANSGISLQGDLTIVDGELQFLAGGEYETSRYDLKTLACLNKPKHDINSQYRTAFYAYYPEYGKFLSLDYTCDDGRTLCHDASYEGSQFTNLVLQKPLPPGVPRDKQEAARWIRRGKNVPTPEVVWEDKSQRRFTSFVVSRERLLAAGHSPKAPDQPFLAAINIADGSEAWTERLPADAVKGGAAIDHSGRIYVSLENGRLLCYAPVQ